MDPLNCQPVTFCLQVMLGHPYTVAIDMWSFGCVAAEMFLGLPLFPGASEYDLLSRIIEMLGMPPASLLAKAKNTANYFGTVYGESNQGAPKACLSHLLLQIEAMVLLPLSGLSRENNEQQTWQRPGRLHASSVEMEIGVS